MSHPEYARLITENQKKLYNYIYSMTGRRSRSWDILQETNLVLMRKETEFTLGSNFEAWAFTTARFQTLAYLRNQKRAPLDVLTPELVELFADEAEELAASSPERLTALKRCRGKLKDKTRKVLTLYYEKEHRIKDICALVGMKESAIKLTLMRARKSLHSCIETQLKQS
ncbi:sigma-70 family RNA polymerase sigma factor [Rubritalea tangerina]|uniref:Sigma-70 family RNA polymerase sigma factor n=2 Tax=Rubritalea tangerina TaxID=430798 RepID=A0ABW4Z950_9BACT